MPVGAGRKTTSNNRAPETSSQSAPQSDRRRRVWFLWSKPTRGWYSLRPLTHRSPCRTQTTFELPFTHFTGAAPGSTAQHAGRPHQHTQRPIVTGTSVLGLKYRDGVMLAADTLCSYVYRPVQTAHIAA